MFVFAMLLKNKFVEVIVWVLLDLFVCVLFVASCSSFYFKCMNVFVCVLLEFVFDISFCLRVTRVSV